MLTQSIYDASITLLHCDGLLGVLNMSGNTKFHSEVTESNLSGSELEDIVEIEDSSTLGGVDKLVDARFGG